MKAEIEIKNLDHLGLVAGLIDELEIENIVNEAVGIDSREKVTAGQIVKGIIINGLDFVSKPLYLFPGTGSIEITHGYSRDHRPSPIN
jgi:transposase